jgi:hypothetical protein
MPTYTFKHKETGEIKEFVLRMSEYDTFKEQNIDLERVFLEAATVSDPYALGRLKPPHDFQKYVLGGIQRRNPFSSKSKRWEVPKEF